MTGRLNGRFGTAALVAGACAVGAAVAADLPATMTPKAPPAPPRQNWTGFYDGVNVGGSWGHQRVSLDDATTGARLLSGSPGVNGVIGGAQIGYNWQPFNRPWVFGVEADIQGSGQKSDGSFVGGLAAPGIVYQDSLDWFGTLRGRVGWAIGELSNWLPYITGGFAYGQGTISGNGTGGGVEWAFWDRWSAKVEYLYADFGRGPTIPLTPMLNINAGRMIDHIGRVGVNYHF